MTPQQKIENLAKVRLPSKKGFQGQSWGGAGVMVISADVVTLNAYKHFQGPKLTTKYAYEMGHLYRELRPIISEHPYFSSLSKLEFWGTLTEQLENTVKMTPDIDLDVLRAQLITTSLEVMKKWDRSVDP